MHGHPHKGMDACVHSCVPAFVCIARHIESAAPLALNIACGDWGRPAGKGARLHEAAFSAEYVSGPAGLRECMCTAVPLHLTMGARPELLAWIQESMCAGVLVELSM